MHHSAPALTHAAKHPANLRLVSDRTHSLSVRPHNRNRNHNGRSMNTLTSTLLLRALLLRPVTATATPTVPLSFLRHQSSARRHTKRLQLPPHPSFTLHPNSPATSHIVYNPPSTSPSVYATPALFLPKDDPRRSIFAAAAADTTPVKARLPPALKRPYEKRYHLTPADFAEIRRLRGEAPDVWTRRKLAERFGTSQFFVGMVCEAGQERKVEMMGRLATIKERWGKRRSGARLDRRKRREGWGGRDGQ